MKHFKIQFLVCLIISILIWYAVPIRSYAFGGFGGFVAGAASPFTWIKIANQAKKTKKDTDTSKSLGKVKTEDPGSEESITYGELNKGEMKAASQTLDSDSYTEFSNSLNTFLDLINYITALLLGLSILSSLLSLGVNIVKLGFKTSQPVAKMKMMSDFASCCVSISLLGSSQLLTKLIIQMVF